MELSPKQKIYDRLFFFVLPTLRGFASRDLFTRIKARAWFLDLSLVLDLAPCAIEPHFTQLDIIWLNSRARKYCENSTMAPSYKHFVPLIRELFTMVPFELREGLEWKGPQDK